MTRKFDSQALMIETDMIAGNGKLFVCSVVEYENNSVKITRNDFEEKLLNFRNPEESKVEFW